MITCRIKEKELKVQILNIVLEIYGSLQNPQDFIKMAKAPKPYKLTEDESFSSFRSWQSNILYVLSRDKEFSPFLKEGAKWNKATAADQTRGLTDDNTENGSRAAEKVIILEQMLGLIAQYVPHFLTNNIVKNSTSL